jgi:hypothetical protein
MADEWDMKCAMGGTNRTLPGHARCADCEAEERYQRTGKVPAVAPSGGEEGGKP